ncbi:helix-turn-helix domain-containing protein [Rossellomorea sp. YZS02]|uniref:helix-turn-helix domain-containing protein n=1 Tax=Rossellomorea sp. YZS02 TaxID=3097358 RepID=UPI002A0E42C2|nr:helix-turn-helix domain-containing protein [Rossellomorea sp. YZS02]MDX8344135.1 helix-turn-helix domain-containing protein [Rossellomorea sp. YZS02]
MDYEAIGKKIVQMRKALGFTQKELAKGICTQALISRIEKGDIYPNASTLYEIANKLGVNLNYFLEVGSTPRIDYIEEVEKQLTRLRKAMEYEEMMDIVRVEEKNPLFHTNPTHLQLLYWHKGIYEKEVENQGEKSFNTLIYALNVTGHDKKVLSEREMEIILSMGVIKFSLEQYEEALTLYDRVAHRLKTHPHLNDIRIQTKLLYNIARVHTRLRNDEESLTYCNEGIKWCLEHENMYLLGEFHYQKGYILELQKDIQEAIRYFKKSELIFELMEDQKYLPLIAPRIKQLEAGTEGQVPRPS